MRVVIQRVRRATVEVAGEAIADIGQGLLILVGVGAEDAESTADWLANKTAELRIFDDAEGKMNHSIRDIGGQALVVSQFTLLADTDKGRRPSYIRAAAPEVAEPLVDRFARQLRDVGVPTQSGRFGAHMIVGLENDGPVTIVIEK
jgi:D-tyrosyl-tRNA(Tyr) deacylase